MTVRCVAVPFSALDPETVYAVAMLRQDVFVVEQQCFYRDLDGRDLEPGTRHALLTDDDALLGYARVLDDGEAWRIGRVLLHPDARGRGLADLVMETALSVSRGRPVVLDAQSALEPWYSRLGFERSGPDFVEDGIPHVPMRKEPA